MSEYMAAFKLNLFRLPEMLKQPLFVRAMVLYWLFFSAEFLSISNAAQNSDSTLADSVAQGWHFIRGAHYDGHSPETGMANSWPPTGPPILWTREIGQGYSSIIAWEDRVATQQQSLFGQTVVCMHADTVSRSNMASSMGTCHDVVSVYRFLLVISGYFVLACLAQSNTS